MEEINGAWISARLTGKRGEQVQLAEAMGISTDKLTKILSGVRKVQAAEIPGLLDFFGIATPKDAPSHEIEAAIAGLSDAKRLEVLRYIEFLKLQQ